MRIRFLRNQRGDAFVVSLILMLVSLMIFLGLQVLAVNLNNSIQYARAKLQMTRLEQEVRNLVNSPYSYQGCDSAAGVASCQIRPEVFSRFSHVPLQGGLCSKSDSQKESANSDCGLSVTGLTFDSGALEVRGKIEAKGSVAIAALDLRIPVPAEVLQSQVFSCPDLDAGKPVFMGLNATGEPRCAALGGCKQGEFMTGVKATTADPICEKLPTLTVSCSLGQVISNFEWKGGGTVDSGCADRGDPYAYFGDP